MEAANRMLQRITALKDFIVYEGYVKEVDFTEDTINWFVEESKKQLATIEESIGKTPIDYDELKLLLTELKELSVSFGALRLNHEINVTRAACNNRNIEEAKVCFQQLKNEMETLKAKLDAYFKLVKGAKDATDEAIKKWRIRN